MKPCRTLAQNREHPVSAAERTRRTVQVLLHEPSMIREITFEMPEEEFRAMLAKNNLILPGDPGFVMP